jgi:acyl-homoserine-lactone acylase
MVTKRISGTDGLGPAGFTFWIAAMKVPNLWTYPFSATDPVNTPYGLNTDSTAVQQAYGYALSIMNRANLPYNVTLGAVQYVVRNGKEIPLPGGPADPYGEFNGVDQDIPAQLGVDPSLGSSYIQVVT